MCIRYKAYRVNIIWPKINLGLQFLLCLLTMSCFQTQCKFRGQFLLVPLVLPIRGHSYLPFLSTGGTQLLIRLSSGSYEVCFIILRDFRPCIVVEVYRRFGKTYFRAFCLLGLLFGPEVGSNTSLRNVSKLVPDVTWLSWRESSSY
jgi:hypothetical protein